MRENKDWFSIAYEHYEEDNYAQAMTAIKHSIKQNPEEKYSELLSAVIYRDLSNYNLAFQIFEKVKPKHNDDFEYKELYFLELGNTYFLMKNYSEALKCYDKIIEINPSDARSYILKGNCLADAGKFELAKIEHLKAVKLSEISDEAFFNLALIARTELKFEEAKEYCKKSLALNPDNEEFTIFYEDISAAIKMTK